MAQQNKRILIHSKLKSEKGIHYTRQHLARLERDGKFPRRIKISVARFGYYESEIDEWLQSKADARNLAATPMIGVPHQ